MDNDSIVKMISKCQVKGKKMAEIVQTWGKRLVEIREKHNMKQADFAKKIGKGETHVSRWERGVSGKKGVPIDLRKAMKNLFSDEEIHYIETGEKIDVKFPTQCTPAEHDIVCEPDQIYNANSCSVPVLSIKASAGAGNNVESIDDFSVTKSLTVDGSLFPGGIDGIRAVQVDGHSMVPVLLPDSWVFFRDSEQWSGDGLYVLVFRGVLMVKLVEADPSTGNLWVKSANTDYKSWEYDPTQDQSTMRIVGRVVRVMM